MDLDLMIIYRADIVSFNGIYYGKFIVFLSCEGWVSKKEKTSTLLVFHSDDEGANEIKEALEGKDVSAKVEAMKKVIMLLLNGNGESLPQLFITIVRYVLPSEDHTVQKLLLLYLEIIDKTDSKGRVLPEMILICHNLRNNLEHPNEYIRGVTLRFLCRVSESEIIEPLVPSVLSNLDHRHPFVRRNAILAIMSIYNNLPHLLAAADAPEMMEKALGTTEQDPSAKRNAFLMLFNCCDRTRAMNYLLSNVDRVPAWSEPMQMVALDSIRKVCRSNPDEKGKYIVIIVSLLTDTSAAVMYECAGMLVSLSSAPTAIMSAATYCQLLLSQSRDDSVKLIILDRLKELTGSHREVMVMAMAMGEDMIIMDVLRALSIPNLDIRRKTLEIVSELITPRNMFAVMKKLNEEMVKNIFWRRQKNGDYLLTPSEMEIDENREYYNMLYDAIGSCVNCFSNSIGSRVYGKYLRP